MPAPSGTVEKEKKRKICAPRFVFFLLCGISMFDGISFDRSLVGGIIFMHACVYSYV